MPALIAIPEDEIEFLRAAALQLENDQNPLPARAAKVRIWLDEAPLLSVAEDTLRTRIGELISLGFKSFDALHLASAEALNADVLCTCDDKFLATAKRHASLLKIRLLNPMDLAQEIHS